MANPRGAAGTAAAVGTGDSAETSPVGPAAAAPEAPLAAAGTPPAARRRNAHGEGGQLRHELIAAASGLLAAGGGGGDLSLRGVARAVGIAAPSVYLHFPSKAALLRAVLDEHFAALERAIEAATDRAVGPAAKLRAGCLAYCRFAAEQPGPYRVLFGGSAPAALGEPTEPPPGMDAFATLVDGIAACMAAGLVPAGDPFAVATGVWPALHGVASLRRSAPGFPWPPLEEQVETILVGLAGLDPAANRAATAAPAATTSI